MSRFSCSNGRSDEHHCLSASAETMNGFAAGCTGGGLTGLGRVTVNTKAVEPMINPSTPATAPITLNRFFGPRGVLGSGPT